jgi:hypothetical protein
MEKIIKGFVSITETSKGKGKGCPVDMPSRHRWEVQVLLYPYSNSVLDGGSVVNAVPRLLDPWQRDPVLIYRMLNGLLGWCGKSRYHRGLEPQTVQPVASSSADYTILVATIPGNNTTGLYVGHPVGSRHVTR